MFIQRSTTIKGLIVLYLFSVVYVIVTQRTFYADGAHYFLKLLEEKSFIYGDDFARHYAHYCTQFPIIILIRIFNVKDLNILSFAFGLGLYFPQLISLWLCYSIAKTKNIYFMLFPVIAIFAIDMNLSFMSVHESHVISNIFWPILFYLVLKEELTWKDRIVLLVLGVVFTRSYESASILGIILLAVMVLIIRERWKQISLLTKVTWAFMGILFVVSILIAVHSIIFPRCPGNKAAFLSSFSAIFEHLPAILSFIYISIISLCIFFPKFSTSILYKIIFILLVVATIFISVTPSTMPELTRPYLQYPARVYMTYMLPLLFIVAFFVLKGTIVVPESTWKKIAILAAFLVIGQTTWQILATKQWDGFRQVFKNELTMHNGVVPYEDTILKEERIGNQLISTMNWGWINPTLSIIWSKDKDVTTIILNSSTYSGVWQPFNPLDIDSLPKVEEFGFSFKKYKNFLLEIKK